MIKKTTKVAFITLITFNLINRASSHASAYYQGEDLQYNQISVVDDIEQSNAYKIYEDFFSRIDLAPNKNFIIPGITTSMVPQGMCDTGEYILISAYDKNKDKNSCIYMIEKSTGQLVKAVYLQDSKSHAGGLAYDGKYVWVANGKKSTLSKVQLSSILNAENGSNVEHQIYRIQTSDGNNIRAAFVTYSEDILWVGQFHERSSQYAYGFPFDKLQSSDSTLIAKYRIDTLSKMQGMAFDNSSRLILSQSYGRYNNSKIYIFDKPRYIRDGDLYYAKLPKLEETITAPPLSENIFVGDDDLLYVLFESAADFYRNGRDNRGKANAPVDRVCPINLNK